MTSRERFEAWAKALPFPMRLDLFTGTDRVTCYAASDTQLAWEAFQAGARNGESEAVRACYDIARGWVEGSKIGADIRQEFPEAFK